MTESAASTPQRLIVSLTSYPARIGGVADVIETLRVQTRKPDAVVLYLAEEQFPDREQGLPENLKALLEEGALEVRWCDRDLKPHKKYFYAFRDFPEDVVITVDDDILYKQTLFERLWSSYVEFPTAVSTGRAHLITCDEDGIPLPYDCWIKAVGELARRPSLQLMATGCGAILYPPHIMPDELFDIDAIEQTCLLADDLWLKTMELKCGVPVVIADEEIELVYVKDSQEVGLRYDNMDRHGNDEQLLRIMKHLGSDERENLFVEKLRQAAGDLGSAGSALYCEQYRLQVEELRAKLKRTYGEKSELNALLQRTYGEKSELNALLQRTYDEKAERGVHIWELDRKVSDLRADKKKLTAKNKDLASEKKALTSEKKALKAEVNVLKDSVAKVKQSRSYRVGRAVTLPARVAKRQLRKLRGARGKR